MFANENVVMTGEDVDITGLAHDSRLVEPGFLFAAWGGAQADGHAFIDHALQRGASSILCEREVNTGSAARIVAPNARRALARAACRFYADPSASLRMVGITGTNGKTTTARIVASVLKAAGHHPGELGTLGFRFKADVVPTGLTTPESVEMLELLSRFSALGMDALVMEVSSHALEQGRVDGVCFDVGIALNLTQDHLDYHGTLDAYFAAKAALVEQRLKSTGVAVVNVDDPWMRRLAVDGSVTFSAQGKPADVRVVGCVFHADRTELQMETPDGTLTITSPLLGEFNVENVCAAVACGTALGFSPTCIQNGVEGVVAVPGRLERVSRAGEPLVLVDYAHTPDGLQKVLQAARKLANGKLFCVFGCGGDRDRSKRPQMAHVAEQFADEIVVSTDNPRSEAPEQIANEIIVGFSSGARYRVCLDRRQAICEAIAVAKEGDVVVVAGKGHETYQIIGETTHRFDDVEEARAALDARATGGMQ